MSWRRRFAALSGVVVAALLTVGLAGSNVGSLPTSVSPARKTPTANVAAEQLGARAADAAGSVPVGSAAYPVPAGSVFAAPWGTDEASGTRQAPVRTLARAIAISPDGGTVVLRGGTYHESVAIYGKRLTIENAPREAVWLDGSSVVDGWVRSGSIWVRTGWVDRFDSSPTYIKGAPDGQPPYGAFINPAHPMASHPDQVFRDGIALRQVSAVKQVTVGTFFLDETSSRLYIGSDPNGHVMRASDLAKAISVRSSGTTLRGFGVRRYAPSVWHIGTVTLERAGTTVENLVVSDNATGGIGVVAADVVLNKVTTMRNGLMGITANAAYNFRLTGSAVKSNNVEHFNTSPSSGGLKITRSRSIRVADNSFDGNSGTGLWLDESDFDAVIVRNNFLGNSGHGVSLEISSRAVVADNLFLGNVLDGLKINDTDRVQVWNNTFVGSSRPIDVVQDRRRAGDVQEPGHDPKRPVPDPTVTWLLRDVVINNNVVAAPHNSNIQATQGRPGGCMVCVEDYSRQRTGAQMNVTYRSNVYNRARPTPTWFAVWSEGHSNPSVYLSFASYREATAQDAGGLSIDGTAVVAPSGVLSPVVTGGDVVATALPAHVAQLVGRPVDIRHFGAWLRS